MPGILIEDDARGWFESTCVRDMTIRNNRFLSCGISIDPQSAGSTEPVHENIRIVDNYFEGSGIHAKGTRGLVITGNRFSGGVSIGITHCEEVRNENNVANAKAP